MIYRGSAALDNTGHASLTTSTLTTGSHSITAVYGGDSNFLSSYHPPLLRR